MEMNTACYLGIDFGTSGCRAVLIDADRQILAEQALPLPVSERDGVRAEQNPQAWWDALQILIPALLQTTPNHRLQAIALDGTSGTVLLADHEGRPLSPALMYDDRRATAQAETIARVAPAESAAHGAGSGLAKLLWLQEHQAPTRPWRVHTQADWLSGMLGAGFGLCDSNNALKLGHDPMQQRWPSWLHGLLPADILPQVVEPGTPIGRLHSELAERWGLSQPVSLIAGTTDSTAAVIASGAEQTAEAITSLGSTLVMKVISEIPIFAPQYGVYSQPYRGRWLVGGGSNSGGAVLRHYFSDSQLAELTPRLHPETPSGLNYMPLLRPGERFPINDPNLAPRLTPRPKDDALFLQGILEAMARIEAEAYRRLADLGAPWPSSVISIGGGAKNPAWRRMREQILGLEVGMARRQQAAYGTALLALGAKLASAVKP